MNITNFKLKDFVRQSPELIEEYTAILKYLPAKQTKKRIFHMKFKDVESIKWTLNNGNDKDLIKIYSKIQKIKKKDVENVCIIEFYGTINSIKEQLKQISDAEKARLTPSKVNIKWEMANGGERMAKYGAVNTLDAVTNNDATKHNKAKNMKYSEIFTILCKRKEASEIQEEMNNIKLK